MFDLENKLGWAWGDKPQELFGAIKKAIDEAKAMVNKVKKVKDKGHPQGLARASRRREVGEQLVTFRAARVCSRP